jgi:hypothetical protein
MGIKIKLKNVRASYCHVFTPRVNKTDDGKDAKPKFEITAILDKKANAEDIKALQKAIKDLSKDPVLKGRAPSKVCLRAGDDTPARAEEYGVDVMTCAARNHKPFHIVDRDGKTRITEADDKVYSGAFVNVFVDLYPFHHPKSGGMICASLEGVQFLNHGDKLGKAPLAPEDMFEDEGDEEDEGNPAD